MAANDFEHTNAIVETPIAATAFEQFILNELLLTKMLSHSGAR
jgi:hypothetical protein